MNSFYNDEQILSFTIKYQSSNALILSRTQYLWYCLIKHEQRIDFTSAEIAVGINNVRVYGRNCSKRNDRRYDIQSRRSR